MIQRGITKAGSIVISLLALTFILIFCTVSFAGEKAGTVTHLSGPLIAKKADGTTRALSIKSEVEQGDLLITEKQTYARIKFTDDGEMILRPNTQFKISGYSFDKAAPKKDSAVFNLSKGGIRSITGMIGKRGDQDSYKVITPTAVAGVRGTTYECKICQGNCGSIPNGLYLFVVSGAIEVKNGGGSQTFSAGQYVYVQSQTTKPAALPGNPGINFTLPASTGGTAKEGDTKGTDRGCVVR